MSTSPEIENITNKLLPFIEDSINAFDSVISRLLLITMVTLVIFFALLAFIIGWLIRKVLISQNSINKYTISIGIALALVIWFIVRTSYSTAINYIKNNYKNVIRNYIESVKKGFENISKMLNIPLPILKNLLSNNKQYIEDMLNKLKINDINANDFINII
jgi:hypothetical protein